MKKRIIYSFVAWLLCMGNTMADNITISDVTVPQGGTVALPINYSFTSTTDKVGFTFSLGFPTGLSLVLDSEGDPVYEKDACINKFNILFPEGNFAGQPQSEKATISGTSGTLLTLQLKADNSLEPGSEHVVNVTKCTFQQKIDGVVTDINIPDFTFTVTIGEPGEARTILDEASTTAPEAANGVDVRVKRTIYANEWSTICLPFAMTEAQCKTAFGDDVQLGNFTSWSSEEDDGSGDIISLTVGFTPVTAIAANHPYIIKVTTPITYADGFTVDGVDIDPEDEPYVQVGVKKADRGYFIGTYVANTVIPEYDLFLNGSKFWYSKGNTKSKAFRGYFEFADVLTEVEEAGAPIFISFDGGTTSLSEELRVKNEEFAPGNEYYTLDGRLVKTPTKGVYIHNGKKIVVK